MSEKLILQPNLNLFEFSTALISLLRFLLILSFFQDTKYFHFNYESITKNAKNALIDILLIWKGY